MSVNEINKKIQSKIHELEQFRDKFVTEKEQLEAVSGSQGRHIQVKAYITRLEHEIKFLNDISVDLESCESEEETINGDEETIEGEELEGEEEYSEDMGEVDLESSDGEEEVEDDEDEEGEY